MKSKPFNSQQPSPSSSPPRQLMSAPVEDLTSSSSQSSTTYFQNPNPNNHQTTDSGIFTSFNFMESNFADSLISKRKYVNVKKHSSVSKPIVVHDDDSLNLGKTSPNASNSGSDSNKLRFTFGANDEFKLGSKVESSGNDFVFGATNESEANGTTVETTTNVNDSHLVDSLSELNLGTGGGPLMNDNKSKTVVENDASENVGFLFPSHQKQESKVKSGDSVNDMLDSGVMFGTGEFNGGFQIGNQNDKRSTVKGRKKPADKKLNSSRRAESSSGNKSFTFGSNSFGETTQSASSSSSKKVILKSVEGESHEIDEKAALQSLTLKYIIEDECDDNIIPIPFDSETILKVIAYCEKHADDKPSNDDKAILEYRSPFEKVDPAVEELKAFDVEFAKVDTDMVQDILLAANFLDIRSLIELMTQTIADRIKGKTPEEIREILNIVSDFTPEEEAAIREEHAWAFDDF